MKYFVELTSWAGDEFQFATLEPTVSHFFVAVRLVEGFFYYPLNIPREIPSLTFPREEQKIRFPIWSLRSKAPNNRKEAT